MSIWTVGFCQLLPDQLQNSLTTSYAAAMCSQCQKEHTANAPSSARVGLLY